MWSANVSPTRGLAWICLMPSSRYSTGSSTEMMLFERVLISDSRVYTVEVLPEPVGPDDERGALRGEERRHEACLFGGVEARGWRCPTCRASGRAAGGSPPRPPRSARSRPGCRRAGPGRRPRSVRLARCGFARCRGWRGSSRGSRGAAAARAARRRSRAALRRRGTGSRSSSTRARCAGRTRDRGSPGPSSALTRRTTGPSSTSTDARSPLRRSSTRSRSPPRRASSRRRTRGRRCRSRRGGPPPRPSR